jgi:hypothetical protein
MDYGQYYSVSMNLLTTLTNNWPGPIEVKRRGNEARRVVERMGSPRATCDLDFVVSAYGVIFLRKLSNLPM